MDWVEVRNSDHDKDRYGLFAYMDVPTNTIISIYIGNKKKQPDDSRRYMFSSHWARTDKKGWHRLRNKKDGSYVVIELKRKQTSDETIGQVTRYMGWIKKKLGDSEVKGIIVAGKFDEKLDYAQEMTPNIEVFLYQVDFKLNEHKR